MSQKEITFSFTPTADDQLQYVLYYATASEVVSGLHSRLRVLMFVAMALLALVFETKADSTFDHVYAALVLIAGVLMALFYKKLVSKRQLLRYKAVVDEQFKGAVFRKTTFVIDRANTRVYDDVYDANMKNVGITKIIEIGKYLIIQLDSAQRYLIPKERIASPAEVSAFFQELAKELGIPYEQDLNWKWM